jgi:nucleoside-triphosphatase
MRIGFEFIDPITNDRNVLASITGNGPRVRKYFVNLEGCRFAAEWLMNAIYNSDFIFFDELR